MNKNILRNQKGFTLIELMVVVFIISILAAIAIPSYRQYAIRNAESQAQASMQQLATELNRWRASALTYKGFTPRKLANNGDISYEYDATDNKTIYVPRGSSSANYSYVITLVDGNTSNTLSPAGTGFTTAGSSWRMFAEPNSSGITKEASVMLFSSTGIQCKSKDRTITEASTSCGAGQETW